jgi:polysaccharide export outer membrane protein
VYEPLQPDGETCIQQGVARVSREQGNGEMIRNRIRLATCLFLLISGGAAGAQDYNTPPNFSATPLGFAPDGSQSGSRAGGIIPRQQGAGSLPGFPIPEFTGKKGTAPAPPGQEPAKPVPPPETPSEFEQFVSGKVEITETQFLSLQQDPKIKFSLFRQPTPSGMISVPVGIFRQETGPPGSADLKIPMGFGYLTAPSDAIAESFNLLGIRSPYSISWDLKQFGYSLFRDPPSTFAPLDNVPVGPDYLVGPGDEIRISIWGKIDANVSLIVDRDGSIAIPKVGTVGVAGLSFRELKEFLRQEFSKYYTGFEMNVSLGALRSITVYVVGNARTPGAYAVSSLSTLVNALFVSGGPSKSGSMRDIQLKRKGETVVQFDLYDLLLKGDKSKDVRLQPEDVLFISPIGPQAAIGGSVNTPGLYEIKGDQSLFSLIGMAGGLSPLAFKGRVRVQRVVENRRQVVLESDIARIDSGAVAVRNGDIVTIFPVVQDNRMVRVAGAVQREGEYGFSEGMTVMDLLSLTEGLKFYAYRKEAELIRVTVTESGPITEKLAVNLEEALQGGPASNIALQENDSLFIRSVPEWKLYRNVSISGEVRYPGTYTILKGERLSSIIDRAGGFTDKAYLKGAVFTRETIKELQQAQTDEMISRLEKETTVRMATSVSTYVTPEEARIKELEFQQMKAFLQTLKTAKAKGRMALPLSEPAALKNSGFDVELEDGDSLSVPSDPQSIQVAGSVFNQTAFIFDPKRTVKEYIELAGGLSQTADKGSVYILKVDGTAMRPGKGSSRGLSWNQKEKRWEYASSPLDSGDSIIVPEKLDRIAWLREFKDITQILYQIAVTAGVLIIAF